MFLLHAIIRVGILLFLNVNVTEGQNLMLTTRTRNVTKGDETVLTCETLKMKPLPTKITFERRTRGTTDFTPACSTVYKAASPGKVCVGAASLSGYRCACLPMHKPVTKKTATVTFRMSLDDEATWRCTSPNGLISNTLSLTVIYPPTTMPIIRRQSTGKILGRHLDMSVNETVNLACNVTGGKPLVETVSLTCSNMYVKKIYSKREANSVIAFFRLEGSMRLHNQTCYCSAQHMSHRYLLKTYFKIFIINFLSAKIEVELGAEKRCTLTCVVTVYPASSQFTMSSAFSQMVKYYTVRSLDGVRRGNTLVATIDPYGVEDLGYYACSATNAVTSVMPTVAPPLHLKPMLVGNSTQTEVIIARLGAMVTLSKTIRPSWRALKGFYWLAPIGRFVIHNDEGVDVQLTIHGTEVDLRAVKVTITVSDLIVSDFGRYTFHVCDSYACSDFYTVLQQKRHSTTTSSSITTTTQRFTPERQTEGMSLGIGILIVLIIVAIVPATWFLYNKWKKHSRSEEEPNQCDKLMEEKKEFNDISREDADPEAKALEESV